MLDVIIYTAAYLTALFFGVFVFTAIENYSKGFRNFVRKLCHKIPFLFRRIIMWVMLVVFFILGYMFLPFGMTRGGLLCGMLGGVFIYFKAGVTMGNNPDPYNKASKRKRLNKK